MSQQIPLVGAVVLLYDDAPATSTYVPGMPGMHIIMLVLLAGKLRAAAVFFPKLRNCGFQVLDPTVAWIGPTIPTIRRGREYPRLTVRLWSPIFLDYLLSSAVTLSRDEYSLPKGMRGSCFAHTLSPLSSYVDGRSRGIVRTDPIPKPGVYSTLPSEEREML